MKKVSIVLSILLALVLLTACGNVSNYTIDYGASQMYSQEDIDQAAKVVEREFRALSGCVLYSLSYAGDEICKDELSYINDLSESKNMGFEECLVFDSEFMSLTNGDGSMQANELYTWSWYLGRETDGEWVLVTYGY